MRNLVLSIGIVVAASSCAVSDEGAAVDGRVAAAQMGMTNLFGATRGVSTTGVGFEFSEPTRRGCLGGRRRRPARETSPPAAAASAWTSFSSSGADGPATIPCDRS